MTIRNCNGCASSFTTTESGQLYCFICRESKYNRIIIKACPTCKIEFQRVNSRIYCSIDCKNKATSERKKEKSIANKERRKLCKSCGNVFIQEHSSQKYCNRRCHNKARRDRVGKFKGFSGRYGETECKTCGKRFWRSTPKHSYCSLACKRKLCENCLTEITHGVNGNVRRKYCFKCNEKKIVNLAKYPIGTKKLKPGGYVLVKIDQKNWMPEHRHLMEKKIKRKLFQMEEVHHKNGIRNDNRLKNLELWSTSHPKGARVKDLIKYAKEILELYGEMK